MHIPINHQFTCSKQHFIYTLVLSWWLGTNGLLFFYSPIRFRAYFDMTVASGSWFVNEMFPFTRQQMMSRFLQSMQWECHSQNIGFLSLDVDNWARYLSWCSLLDLMSGVLCHVTFRMDLLLGPRTRLRQVDKLLGSCNISIPVTFGFILFWSIFLDRTRKCLL